MNDEIKTVEPNADITAGTPSGTGSRFVQQGSETQDTTTPKGLEAVAAAREVLRNRRNAGIGTPANAIPRINEMDAGAEIEASVFEDDTGTPGAITYSFTVIIHGTIFKCVELTRDDLKKATDEIKRIETLAKNLDKRTNIEEKNLLQKYKKARTDEVREQLQSQMDELTSQRAEGAQDLAAKAVAINRWVVEQSLKGWDNPKWTVDVPLTEANRNKLSKTTLATLSDSIVAKSVGGRAATDNAMDFLGR